MVLECMIKLYEERPWQDSEDPIQSLYYFYIIRDLSKYYYKIHLRWRHSWVAVLLLTDEEGNEDGKQWTLSLPVELGQDTPLRNLKRAVLDEVKIVLE